MSAFDSGLFSPPGGFAVRIMDLSGGLNRPESKALMGKVRGSLGQP